MSKRVPEPPRPYLRLCSPCNHKSFEAGDDRAPDGVELCEPCADAVDQWHLDFAAWKIAHAAWLKRRARNKRKATLH